MIELSPATVDRFCAAYVALVDAVRQALSTVSSGEGAVFWKASALPILEGRVSQVQAAVKSFQNGELKPLAQLAGEACGLSKHMDGWPFDFAGSEHEAKLGLRITDVVVAAYEIHKVAHSLVR